LDTLRGLYVFSASGFIIPAAPASAQPKAIIELIRFNGDGTLDVPGATRSADRGCLGALTFLPSGPHFDLFIPLDGREIRMIQTAQHVFQGAATKLGNRPICTSAKPVSAGLPRRGEVWGKRKGLAAPASANPSSSMVSARRCVAAPSR
jgi:hypothetical protein